MSEKDIYRFKVLSDARESDYVKLMLQLFYMCLFVMSGVYSIDFPL
ncbi:hypothetical protein [Vibrio campbellii]